MGLVGGAAAARAMHSEWDSLQSAEQARRGPRERGKNGKKKHPPPPQETLASPLWGNQERAETYPTIASFCFQIEEPLVQDANEVTGRDGVSKEGARGCSSRT